MVTDVAFFGTHQRVELTLVDKPDSAYLAHYPPRHPIAEGARVVLRVDAGSVLLLPDD